MVTNSIRYPIFSKVVGCVVCVCVCVLGGGGEIVDTQLYWQAAGNVDAFIYMINLM